MQTIINIDHWPRSKFVTVTEIDGLLSTTYRPDTFFCQYTTGMDKPNYPVPAIRYDADWFDDFIPAVIVFRLYTDDDYELPEIVAHWSCETRYDDFN